MPKALVSPGDAWECDDICLPGEMKAIHWKGGSKLAGLFSEAQPECAYSGGVSSSLALFATSAFAEISPAENLDINSCHVADSDGLTRSGAWKIFPLDSAHLTISAVV